MEGILQGNGEGKFSQEAEVHVVHYVLNLVEKEKWPEERIPGQW